MAALAIVQSLYHVVIHVEKKYNHEIVEDIIAKDLAESWDTMDDQLVTILNLISNCHLYDEDAGLLCERAGLIYLQKGDSIDYYKYLGYAIFYLEDSKDDKIYNIYLDLANFYLNTYASDAAEEMLKSANSIKPIDEIENPQIKIYAYRMQGIMYFMQYNYNDAETALMKSKSILEDHMDEPYSESYSAMNDVWLARIYEETGRLSKCKELLDKWEDSKLFTTPVYRTISLRDFVIPYYQAKCYYLCAENIKEYSNTTMDSSATEQAVIDFLHEFMTLCEENNYEKAELYTILKVQKEYPTRNEAIQKELNFVLNELYAILFDQQNITYARVINDIVYDAKNELEINKSRQNDHIRRLSITVTAVVSVGILIVLMLIPIINARFDGLTNLLTRNIFTHDLKLAKHSKVNYGVIMVDIDDFKHINDTYGHLHGDDVLFRVGELLNMETVLGVKAYRYGGEEFVLLVEKEALYHMGAIAERIRHSMELQPWDFDKSLVITVSIGCSQGSGEQDVVKLADDNLYYSKTHGKNQVTI